MKALRLFTFVFLVVLLVATLAPAPVYAAPPDNDSSTVSFTIDPAKSKLA
jgi:hypothetical protein